MQILKSFLLCVLGLTKLLNQVLLYALKLAHFVDNGIDGSLLNLLSFSVLSRDRFLLLYLRQCFVLEELALVHLYLL